MSAHVTAPPTAGSDQLRGQGRSLLQRIFLGRETAPRWARPALWGVLLLATAVYVYGLGENGDANSYYAAAVLSGTKSWSSMFFGSLDTGNFITVDKPPFALWVMEVSCRIFGFGTWQMLLPIAACGIAAVGVLYSAVRRVFGHTAATVAGLVMALTPITVAITRDNNPDPVLVLLTVSAAWCCLEAIRSGKLQPLVWSAVLVGFAFNTKMLQAYMVLPAFFLAYVWAARGSVLKRVRNLLIAGVALVVSSGWWMVIVDSIPKSDRPFVGSSTKDTVWDLVTGYNGLARITGNSGGAGGGGGGANFGGTAGIGRLFNSILGGQISWLIPFAAIALVGALVLRGRRRRTDLQRASYLLWGGWLLTHYVTFSFASGTFHPYYTTMLAPAIAALTGAGGLAIFRAFRVRSAAWAWVLPLGIAVSAVWAIVLLRRSTSFDSWLWPTIAVLAVAAVVFLLVARFGRVAGPLFTVGAAAALIALLAGPAAYAADTATAGAVNGTNPSSGPSTGGGFGGGGAPGGGGGFGGGLRGERPTGTTGGQGFPGGGQTGEMPTGGFPGGGDGAAAGGGAPTGSGAPTDSGAAGSGAAGGAPTGGGFGGGGGMGGGVSTQMLSYLEAHQDGATWLVATSSAQTADGIILSSGGKAAIAMGGFTGSDPAMSVAQIKEYISSGKLHYVLVGGGGGMGGDANSAATAYVTSTCTVVSASAYGGTNSTSSSTTSTSDTANSTEKLYYCKS